MKKNATKKSKMKNPVRDYLTKYLLTMREFSEITGIPLSTISNYCLGTRQPDKKNARRLIAGSQGEITAQDLGY